MAREIGSPQRELEPVSGEAQASVPRAELEVVAEPALQLAEYGGRRAAVQAVAAVIDADTGHVERRGHAAEVRRTLDQLDVVTLPRRQPRRRQPGRPAAQDEQTAQAVTRMRALAKEPTPT